MFACLLACLPVFFFCLFDLLAWLFPFPPIASLTMVVVHHPTLLEWHVEAPGDGVGWERRVVSPDRPFILCTHKYIQIHTDTYRYIQNYIQIHTITYINTYIHTYIHTLGSFTRSHRFLRLQPPSPASPSSPALARPALPFPPHLLHGFRLLGCAGQGPCRCASRRWMGRSMPT